MQNTTSNIRYFTKDTLLASWLHMNGINYDGITSDETAQIIFNGSEDDINQLIEVFRSGNPHGNIITFFRSYKYLLSKIKER